MKTREDKIFNAVGHAVMLVLSAAAVIPIILMVISSLTSNGALLRDGYSFFPKEWSVYAYKWVFASNGGMVLKAYGISFLITTAGTACSLLLTIGLAYGLAKKSLPGRKIFTFLVVFTMLFNGGLVPTYINYTNVFHIKDTIFALLVPSLLMNAFNVLLMKSYFVSSVPDEILEAAYIDGASEFQTMRKIAVPLSKPIIATVGMFAGIAYWNDWMTCSLYIETPKLHTLQYLLQSLMNNIGYLQSNAQASRSIEQSLGTLPSEGARMATCVLAIGPIILLYPLLQKYFEKGLTIGAVKE